MSKRNRIVERASDVNGGQYIQTNHSYNSGYEDGKKAGKEYCAAELAALREQVEKLTKERDALRSRRCEVCGYLEHEREHTGCLREQLAALTKERDELKTVPMKYRRMQFNAELQDEVTQLQKQLAALAEQNAKMRKALTKWRYLDSSYNWRCGHCGNEEGDGHKEGCALALPNLASPVLNRIKAEAYREAAEICEAQQTWITNGAAGMLLRAKSDELEQQCAP